MYNSVTFCNTIREKAFGGETMKFQLKPDRKESENKTIRFPVPLIERIEKAIAGRDVTFSGFVLQACEYALNNMASEEEE